MSGIIQNNRIYLSFDECINHKYSLCFGINNIQGFEPTKFYLYSDDNQGNFCVTFNNNQYNQTQCLINIDNNPYIVSHVPIVSNITSIETTNYIDITDIFATYSNDLLILAYDMINCDIEKQLGKKSDIKNTYSYIKSLSHGIQIAGTIRNDPSFTAKYSIEYVINLYQLSDTPMIGRVGDPHIGYFYNSYHIGTDLPLFGEQIVIINRMNLNKKPWKFVIDKTIPDEFYDPIKNGILSWNAYFKYLNLGEPFYVLPRLNDDEYDVFDMNHWYIVGTNIENFNGPYSAYSVNVIDNRSGENLCGIISMNLTRIKSNPLRYFIMNGRDPHQISEYKHYFEQYISWVIAHEIGHQLGLRHNFMGQQNKDHLTTVMDYNDLFDDMNQTKLFNPQGVLREYDLHAIEYGYCLIPDEKTGIKHDKLKNIVSNFNIPFGTDENFTENINPLITKNDFDDKPLDFVTNHLSIYYEYRQNMIELLNEGKINSFEYNNTFMFLYTQKYPDLIDMCLKYLGGRYFNQQRDLWIEVGEKEILKSIGLLLQLINSIEYSQEEYKHFVYELRLSPISNEFSIYSTNVTNLYNIYQGIIQHIFKNMTIPSKFIIMNQSNFKYKNMLYCFTFSYKTIKQTPFISESDGIFPELGAIMNNDDVWKVKMDMILKSNTFKLNQRINWVEYLVTLYKKSTNGMIKSDIFDLLIQIQSIFTSVILRLPSINVQHWLLLNQIIREILPK